MSLKPIDSSKLRDDEYSDNFYTQGASGIHHYDKMKGGRGGHSEDPKTKRLLFTIGAIAAVVLLIIAAVFVVSNFVRMGEEQQAASNAAVDITIPSGYGSGDIAQLLQANGVILKTTDFLNAVDRVRADGSLKAGAYHFESGMSYDDVVALLTSGPNASVSLTIAEGLTVNQTAGRVQDVMGIPAETFLAQARASNYATDYPFLAGAYNDSLEGFLYPETYILPPDSSADAVIRAMLDQYKAVTSMIDFNAAAQGNVALTQYQVICAASLVERETAISSERPLVASVIYNRLNAGWPLQIDAAIAYALGKADLLTEADPMVDSPYNVYLNYGLTPGPICSPSHDSIIAVTQPASTDYFYYVASSALDGSHVFCSNDEQFEQAKAEYNAAMGIG